MKNNIKLRDGTLPDGFGTIQEWGQIDLTTKMYTAEQIEKRIGTINGTISQYIADNVSSAYIFKGSKSSIEALPTTGQKVGDVYNITDSFTLDGNTYTAGTDVAWIVENSVGKWNALGGKTFDDTGVIKSVNNITPAQGSHAITIPDATTTDAGLMSATDKTKLNGVAAGAQVNVIETVKVDNVALTPDANKAVNIDLSGKANQSEMSVVAGTGSDADKTTITLKTGTSATVLTAHQDITGKADKVANATSGNFAGLDANGNLTDSGKNAANFQPAGNYKTTQKAITTDPDATGTASAVVTSVKQTANGEIIVVRANLPTAATVDQTYNATSTNAQSGTAVAEAVSGAVGNLDAEVTSSGGTNVQVKVTQVDGVVTAVNVTDNTASGTHTHGNISNDGKVGTASGKVLVTGEGGAVEAGELDGTYNATTNKVATQSTVTDAIAALDVTEVSVGASKTVDKISETDGKISVTATPIQIAESQVTDLTTHLAAKADKVSGATSGNFAGLDGNGNLTDSGSKAADFATAAQGTKADNAVQGVKLAGAENALALDANKIATIPLAGGTGEGATNGLMTAADKAKLDGFDDASEYKTKQTAVVDTGTGYVSSITQDTNGVISVTKTALPTQTTYTLSGSGATVTLTPTTGNVEGTPTSHTIPDATTSAKGVVQLTDATDSTSTTTAATANAVKTAKDAADTADGKAVTAQDGVDAIETRAAALLTAVGESNPTMNTANDIKAAVEALYNALRAFATKA